MSRSIKFVWRSDDRGLPFTCRTLDRGAKLSIQTAPIRSNKSAKNKLKYDKTYVLSRFLYIALNQWRPQHPKVTDQSPHVSSNPDSKLGMVTNSTRAAAFALPLLLLWACSSTNCRADPDLRVRYKICSGDTFPGDSLYAEHSGLVLNDLVDNTPCNGYDYYMTSPGPSQFVYGHGACNGGLSHKDCHDCLYQAMLDTFNDCLPLTVGLQVQLVDCRIRYEIYPFIDT